MRLAAIFTSILLLVAAGQVRAQDPSSEARRLLQGAADPGDFTDVSAGGAISLKHKPSGLICSFGPDPRGNSLHASPEGVICETGTASEIDTLEAFHTAPASDSDIQGAIARAMGAFTGPRPVSGFTDDRSDRPGAPSHVSRRFVANTRDGQALFVRVAYAQVGGWFVLQRVISAPATAQQADADGERRLLMAIGQMMDKR